MDRNDPIPKKLRDLLMGALLKITSSLPELAEQIHNLERQWDPNDPQLWVGDREATCNELNAIIGELEQTPGLPPNIIKAIEKLKEAQVLLACDVMT